MVEKEYSPHYQGSSLEEHLLVYLTGKPVIPFEVQLPGFPALSNQIHSQNMSNSRDCLFLPSLYQMSNHYHIMILPDEGTQRSFFFSVFSPLAGQVRSRGPWSKLKLYPLKVLVHRKLILSRIVPVSYLIFLPHKLSSFMFMRELNKEPSEFCPYDNL